MKSEAGKKISDAMGAQPPAKHEWDFAGTKALPNDEIEACYLYEYARDFFKGSPILQKLRRAWEKHNTHESAKGLDAWCQAHDLLAKNYGYFPYITFDSFPIVAWQDLPKDGAAQGPKAEMNSRKSLAEDVNDWFGRERKSPFDRLYMATLRELGTLNSRPADILDLVAGRLPRRQELSETYALAVSEFEMWNLHRPPSEHTEYGLFLINWSYGDPEIKRAFDEWLNGQRQERKRRSLVSHKPVSNRGGFRDKLRWLGALRVMEFYKQKCNRRTDWVTHPEQMLRPEVKAPYSYYPDLSAAAKKAKQEIARLFPQVWNARRWRLEREERSRSFQEAIRNPASPFYMGIEGVGYKV